MARFRRKASSRIRVVIERREEYEVCGLRLVEGYDAGYQMPVSLFERFVRASIEMEAVREEIDKIERDQDTLREETLPSTLWVRPTENIWVYQLRRPDGYVIREVSAPAFQRVTWDIDLQEDEGDVELWANYGGGWTCEAVVHP